MGSRHDDSSFDDGLGRAAPSAAPPGADPGGEGPGFQNDKWKDGFEIFDKGGQKERGRGAVSLPGNQGPPPEMRQRGPPAGNRGPPPEMRQSGPPPERERPAFDRVFGKGRIAVRDWP